MNYAFLVVAIFALFALMSLAGSIGKIADAWTAWMAQEQRAAEEEDYRHSFGGLTGPTALEDHRLWDGGPTGPTGGPTGPTAGPSGPDD